MEVRSETIARVQRNYGVDWLRTSCILLLFPFLTVFLVCAPDVLLVYAADVCYSGHIQLLCAPKTYFRAIPERTLCAAHGALFVWHLVVPIQGYLARVQQFGYTGGYFCFLSSYFTNFSDLTGYTGSFTPAHLWFLLYLLIISAGLLPVLLRIKRNDGDKPSFWGKPSALIFAFVPLTIASALPGVGGKNPFYFAAFFLLGYWIAHRNLMDTIKKYRGWFLIGALFLGACFMLIGSRLQFASGYSMQAAVVALLRDAAAWLMILALVGLAQAHCNKPGRALNYCNGASFPVYILHQSVMMAVAFYVVPLPLPSWGKFLLIAVGSLLFSLAGYEIFRHFKATRFVLGMK